MYPFVRKHRGPLAAELAKSTGGVLAMAGSVMFCRVMLYRVEHPSTGPTSYAQEMVLGGDLWGNPADPHMWMWLGVAAMAVGVLARFVGWVFIERSRT